MKRIFYFLTLIFIPFQLIAQSVQFKAIAPSSVVAGEPFQLQYSVNRESASNLQVGKMPDFDMLNRPTTYTSQEFQFINGKSSQSVSTTYTYMIMAQKAGTFSIPPATITVEGKQYTSNPLTIKVLPAETKQQQSGRDPQDQQISSQKISSENIFIRPILSKTNVREQEMILLTYKIYYKVDLVDINSVKMPDFENFMTHDIEGKQPQDIENYNGQNYYTVVLKQMLISPQKAGKLTLGSMSCNAVVRLRQTVRDPRSFFGAYNTYQDVKKQISSGVITINVKPLPEPKPADFSGAVGSLEMKSTISSKEIEANNSATITITIKGTGNLKLIKTPKIDFPTDFEVYDPKVSNNFTVSQSGFSGNKTIEYLFIPRHSGKFKIPAVTLTYFDFATNSYKTLKTDEYDLNILKGSATNNASSVVYNGVEKEQVKQLANDIGYIKTGNLRIHQKIEPYLSSMLFWLLLIVPLLITILLAIIFNKIAKENANIAFMRNKKANKVAKKRLKTAEKYLKENNKDSFYDEMLSVIWIYISDKLSISIANLNKEKAEEELGKKGVSEELSQKTINLLSECEWNRYAPVVEGNSEMDNVYKKAIDLIEKLENSIKNRQKITLNK